MKIILIFILFSNILISKEWVVPIKIKQPPEMCIATTIVHSLIAKPICSEISNPKDLIYDIFEQSYTRAFKQSLGAILEIGYINGWEYLRTTEDIINNLNNSPIIFLMPLYNSMFDINKNNPYWQCSGEIINHHAVLITSYKNGIFTIINTWGREWGLDGKVYMKEKDFKKLFDNNAIGAILF